MLLEFDDDSDLSPVVFVQGLKEKLMPTYPWASRHLDWQVSRACDGGTCIEVARRGELVAIGNANNLEGPVNESTLAEWSHFLADVKLGYLDGILCGLESKVC